MAVLLEYTPVTSNRRNYEYFTPDYQESTSIIVPSNIEINQESDTFKSSDSKKSFLWKFSSNEELLINNDPVTISYNSPSVSYTKTTNGYKYSRGNLRAEILQLLEQELGWKHDRDFHLGEAVRSRNTNYGSKTSHHFSGNAVDITPRGNMTYEKMRLAMLGNAKIRKFFLENGLGIIDESTEAIRRTHSWKATGNHYHIGPDRLAVSTWNNWSRQAGYAKFGGILKAQKGATIDNDNLLVYLPVLTTSLRKAVSPMGFLDNSYLDYFLQDYDQSEDPQNTENNSTHKNNIERARNAMFKWIYNGNETNPSQIELSHTSARYYGTDDIEYDGIKLPRRFLDALHWNETKTKFGHLQERYLEGIDIKDARGNKTYGAGLLYDPDTGQLMSKITPPGKKWNEDELNEKFLKTIINAYKSIQREFGNLAPNLIEALTSTRMLYGHIPESLKNAIKQGNSSRIKHAWMHAHDGDRKYSKFKGGWDKRSMFEYLWFMGDYCTSADDPKVLENVKSYFSK